jgi:hypothetical protein
MRACPERMQPHLATVLPAAFIARLDADSAVAGCWADVWSEGAASEAGAARLYGEEIVGGLTAGLGSANWGRKKACAEVGGMCAGEAGWVRWWGRWWWRMQLLMPRTWLVQVACLEGCTSVAGYEVPCTDKLACSSGVHTAAVPPLASAAPLLLCGCTPARWLHIPIDQLALTQPPYSCRQAITQLAELAPDALAHHTERLCTALISEAGGRLWDGKESVLAALAAVAKADAAGPQKGALVGKVGGGAGCCAGPLPGLCRPQLALLL